MQPMNTVERERLRTALRNHGGESGDGGALLMSKDTSFAGVSVIEDDGEHGAQVLDAVASVPVHY